MEYKEILNFCSPCLVVSQKLDENKQENAEENKIKIEQTEFFECTFCLENCTGSMVFLHNDPITNNIIKCRNSICASCIGLSIKLNKQQTFRCGCGRNFDINNIKVVPDKNFFTNIICPNCNAKCQNDITYRTHILEKCMKSPRVCLRCNHYIEPDKKKQHDNYCHYECKKCNKSMYYLQHKIHACYHIKCKDCDRMFTNKKKLHEHILNIHNIKCHCCNIYHKNIKASLPLAKCTQCYKNFCFDKFLCHNCSI